jgi:hypothetical protein
MASRKAGVITIDLLLGTGQFAPAAEGARAKLDQIGSSARQMGQHGVTGVQAVSGALRVLEGGVTNNLRAAERFTANVLGLGPILQAAFPVIGAIAFLGIVVKLGEEVHKFYTEMRDAPEKLAGGWRTLSSGITLSNDELRVSVDKIEQEIAKLEGRRQNTLKTMLDEAKVSSDKLGESLDKSFREFAKFLEENKPGALRQIFGEQSTFDLRQSAGGYTGTGGIQTRLDQASKEGEVKIAEAKTPKDLRTAELARDAELQKILNDELDRQNKALAEFQRLSKPQAGGIVRPEGLIHHPPGSFEGAVAAPGTAAKDETANIAQTQDYIKLLNNKREAIELDARLREATRKRDEIQAGKDFDRVERPAQDRINKLKSEFEGISIRLAGAGYNQGVRIAAEATAAAIKDIEEVNKLLEKQGTPGHRPTVSADQAKEIEQYELKIKTTTAEEVWRQKLAETTLSINEQIKSQELLTSAVGKGYEAVKRASVETQLISKVGPEAYEDPKKKFAVNIERQQLGDLYDKEHARQVADSIDKLHDQITLEETLARVQVQGAEVVRLATLQVKLAKMEENGATREQLDAELAAYRAQRANQAAAEIAGINEKISATQRLTDATVQGAEAERRAALENKYIEMQRNGATPEVIQQQRKADESENQQKITTKVAGRVNEFSNRLTIIDQEQIKLKSITVTEENRAGIERAGKELENERLNIVLQQYVAVRNLRDANLQILADISVQMGSAKDGVRAFFLEMQKQARTAAAIIEETLTNALDRVSDNLAKALTGQKTAWAQTFKDLGQNLLKETIKSDLQKGLGSIAQRFGITGLGSKPDGSKSNPLWVQMAGSVPAAGTSGAPGLPGIPGASAGKGTVFGGNQGGFVFNFLKAIGAKRPDEGTSGAVVNKPPVPQPTLPSVSIGKPDGTQGNPFYVVMAGAGVAQPQSGASNFFKTAGSIVLGAAVSGAAKPAGARAAGGPVDKGKMYLVGERGPEYFTPETSGHIIKNETTEKMMAVHHWINGRGAKPSDGATAKPFSIKGARAEGGDVTAGSAYMVGERGPELFAAAGASGGPESRSDGTVGGTQIHIGEIHTGGGDPQLTKQSVIDAMRAVHGQSVSVSIQAINDRQRRTPASKH